MTDIIKSNLSVFVLCPVANITYLQLVVEDQQDRPIAHVFPQIHDFLKQTTGLSGDDNNTLE